MKSATNENIKIRPISIKDTQARHKFFVELSLDQVGMVHTADEIDFHSQESEDKIRDFINNQRGLWLIAENSKSEIVGEIDITVKNMRRVRHNGFLTIGVIPNYQGMGIGSGLMDEAIFWSKQQGLRRLELSVFASNNKAIKLYLKHGFSQEGLRKSFLHNEDGSFEDDLIMAHYLQ